MPIFIPFVVIFTIITTLIRAEEPCGRSLRTLRDPISPYRHYFVPVRNHKIYVQESGNPEGRPVIILHGQLTGHIQSRHAQIFDPTKYRIIQYDQRGYGKSHPFKTSVSIEQDIEDLERIRRYLKIPIFEVIFGSTFGSTIAAQYALYHPHRVYNLVLNAAFLARKSDWEFSYDPELFNRFPKIGEDFARHIQTSGPEIIDASRDRVRTRNLERLKQEAFWIRAWGRTLIERRDQEIVPVFDSLSEYEARTAKKFVIHQHALARENPLELASLLHRLQDVHVYLLHGEEDLIAPVEGAKEFDFRLPSSTLLVSKSSGHSMLEPQTTHSLVNVADWISQHSLLRQSDRRSAP